MSDTDAKPARSARSSATRKELLRAARECFARLGFQGTTIREIADAAGMTTGIIYYYFDSKHALFRAVMQEVSRLVIDEFELAVQSADRFDEQFIALLDAAARIHERDPSIARFTACSPIEIYRDPTLLSSEMVGDSTLQHFFQKFVQGAADAGQLPESLEVRDIENMVVSLTLGLAYYSVVADSPKVLRSAMKAAGTVFSLALDPDN